MQPLVQRPVPFRRSPRPYRRAQHLRINLIKRFIDMPFIENSIQGLAMKVFDSLMYKLAQKSIYLVRWGKLVLIEILIATWTGLIGLHMCGKTIARLGRQAFFFGIVAR